MSDARVSGYGDHRAENPTHMIADLSGKALGWYANEPAAREALASLIADDPSAEDECGVIPVPGLETKAEGPQ